MKYKLLALDVDGTIAEPPDVVRPATVRAVAAAEAAGLRVCLATGRNYAEVLPIWRRLPLSQPYEPMVLVGGALVSEPDTGRTLYEKAIARDVAVAFADALGEAGHCAMVLVDPWRHGVDYYLTTRGDVAWAERTWFSKIDVRVRRVRRLSEVAALPRPLRISAVPRAGEVEPLAARLQEAFGGQLAVHPILAPNYGVMMVEAHARGADKLSGVTYVAQAHRIGRAQVAAVGDDVNDLAMIRGVGLGVAMADAPAFLKEASDRVAEEGLPAFVDRLVSGAFDG